MAKSKKQDTPKWVWVLVPALFVFFVGFLLYLSTLPASKDEHSLGKDLVKFVQEKRQHKPAETEAPDTKTTQPEPYASDYEFYQLLESQKIETSKVDAYKSTPKDSAGVVYRLQVASFRSKEDADRLRANLIIEGLAATIQSSEVKGTTWHRVLVGPFSNRSAMNKAQDQLAARRMTPIEIKETVKK